MFVTLLLQIPLSISFCILDYPLKIRLIFRDKNWYFMRWDVEI